MMSNIRYRLIQIVEILLWLGALAGLARIALHAWQVRDAGVMAMLELAGPPLLALGGAMAGLIVLIGVYHNTRRNTEAVERLAKQGAGSLRRLPGAARPESAAVPPATSRRMSFAAPEPEPQPPAAPVPVMVAPPPQPEPEPEPEPPAPVAAPAPEAAPVIPHVEPAPEQPAPTARAMPRRLGPAS